MKNAAEPLRNDPPPRTLGHLIIIRHLGGLAEVLWALTCQYKRQGVGVESVHEVNGLLLADE